MNVVAFTVTLLALVVLLVRTKQVRVGSAVVCVILGLVLGASPAGPALFELVTVGWLYLWDQVNTL